MGGPPTGWPLRHGVSVGTLSCSAPRPQPFPPPQCKASPETSFSIKTANSEDKFIIICRFSHEWSEASGEEG